MVERLVYTDALTNALTFSYALLSALPKVKLASSVNLTLSEMCSKNFASIKNSVKSKGESYRQKKMTALRRRGAQIVNFHKREAGCIVHAAHNRCEVAWIKRRLKRRFFRIRRREPFTLDESCVGTLGPIVVR